MACSTEIHNNRRDVKHKEKHGVELPPLQTSSVAAPSTLMKQICTLLRTSDSPLVYKSTSRPPCTYHYILLSNYLSFYTQQIVNVHDNSDKLNTHCNFTPSFYSKDGNIGIRISSLKYNYHY